MSGMRLLVLMVCSFVNVLAWSRIGAACGNDARVLGWGVLSATAIYTLGYASAALP